MKENLNHKQQILSTYIAERAPLMRCSLIIIIINIIETSSSKQYKIMCMSVVLASFMSTLHKLK